MGAVYNKTVVRIHYYKAHRKNYLLFHAALTTASVLQITYGIQYTIHSLDVYLDIPICFSLRKESGGTGWTTQPTSLHRTCQLRVSEIGM
ncbi:hypothetical protein CDAR_272741 [Caerostris darwini]|uniref:Uncharacterized protein n=1 Tax=Caerostris darwini TaxID=1538125 RepID=A0AAV4V0I9_9ARAC|nr:hypothetical protein CDAR_272741 [Caerostris darwini]